MAAHRRGRTRRPRPGASHRGSCSAPRWPTAPDFTVRKTGAGWRVRGDKPERWVRQTDFTQRRGRRLPGRPARPARRRGPSCSRRAPSRATACSSARATTPWSSTSSRHRGRGRGAGTSRRGPAVPRRAPGRPPPPRHAAAIADRLPGETRADVARRLAAVGVEVSEDELARLDAEDSSRGTSEAGDPDGSASPDVGRVRTLAGRRLMSRAEVLHATRIVVKVGSSSLTDARRRGHRRRRRPGAGRRAGRAARSRAARSSWSPPGAIAAGLAPLGLSRRPRDLATQQAAAASARGCWCPATPRRSPATASWRARCC